MACGLINKLTDILKIQEREGLVFDYDEESCYVKAKDGQLVISLILSAKIIGEQSERPGFVGRNKEEEAAVYQWVEYSVLHIARSKDRESIFNELNCHLEDKTFFVNNRLTLADAVLYLQLHEFFVKMTFQEKENFPHVSRWFKQVQYELKPSDSCPAVVFSKTSLYC